jgi:hypothetical protein
MSDARIRSLLIAVALSWAAPAAVHAEGVRVLGTIQLTEVTHRSRTILSVSVRQVAPVWRTQADGSRVRIGQRLKVHVEGVLRGPAALRGATLWLDAAAREVPGRLRVIARDYPGSYDPQGAKVADRFVAYVRAPVWPGETRAAARRGLTLWHADADAARPRVARVVGAQERRRALRRAKRTARAAPRQGR